jgi:hypothetical protein
MCIPNIYSLIGGVMVRVLALSAVDHVFESRSDQTKYYTMVFPVSRLSMQYGFVNYKKGALDSQPQVIKFTSCFAHGR